MTCFITEPVFDTAFGMGQYSFSSTLLRHLRVFRSAYHVCQSRDITMIRAITPRRFFLIDRVLHDTSLFCMCVDASIPNTQSADLDVPQNDIDHKRREYNDGAYFPRESDDFRLRVTQVLVSLFPHDCTCTVDARSRGAIRCSKLHLINFNVVDSA